MTYDVQFVDSISATATIRLDLQTSGLQVQAEGTVFGLPELRRSVVSTLLVDGDQYPAAAYGNRVLSLVVRVDGASDDAIAAQAQLLIRELDRPRNILRYRPGTSAPVFFRTYRAGPDNVQWDPFTKEVRAQIPADPFAYGLRESLPQVTVYADPAEGTTLNANPYFETDASLWTALGGTVVRSTAQAHEGVASLLLTPDGVSLNVEARSENVPASPGQQVRASAWVRCAVARSVNVGIIWRDAGAVLLSSSLTPLSIAANTWTLIDVTATAPTSTATAQLVATMGSTPPASNTLHIDEARLRRSGGVGGCCFDVTGVKGDVETPLYLSLDDGFTVQRQPVVAVRRRGTPSQLPMLLQAESMGAGTDTALGAANDAGFSGAGQNYMRVSFTTNQTLISRLTISEWPAAPSVDVRGTYRVFARVRRNTGGDALSLRLAWGTSSVFFLGDTVALPASITDPIYVDLGLVQFPAGQDPVTDGMTGGELAVRGMFVSLAAQRSSGSGTLDVDFLLFVPADDRLMIATVNPDSGATAQVVDAARTMVYGVGASGEIRTAAPAQIAGSPPMVSPGVTSRVVFVPSILQSAVSGSITLTAKVTPYYWPRYIYVRPVAS